MRTVAIIGETYFKVLRNKQRLNHPHHSTCDVQSIDQHDLAFEAFKHGAFLFMDWC